MSPFRYRLSVHPTLAQFQPELEYVCAFLDHAHWLERVQAGGDGVLHYGPDAPPGAVHVPAVLFPACVRVGSDGIRPERTALAAREEGTDAAPGLLATLLGAPVDGRRLTYDAIGLIFHLLSRLEERGSPDLDRYNRFTYKASLLVRRRSLTTPVCDDAARDIAFALTGDRNPHPRTQYRVWLTHDFDSMRGYHRPLEPLRNMLGDVLRRGQPRRALARLRRTYLSGEPFRSFRHILGLSEKHGHRSSFFFMGRSDDTMDSPYMLRHRGLVRRVGDEIAARGHVLGFHPGFLTCNNPQEWQRQKRDVEEILGREVTTGRQHVLRFDAEQTLDIWNDGGMELDMTLAYPEQLGFRTGTCRSHPTYSLRRRKTMKLVEYPSAIMDFGMFGGRYRDISLEQAHAECSDIVAICRSRGGHLVVLYHPGQWADAKVRHWYENLVPIL